jgi:predicted RNA binding protein YcfA (HicA-like mRNA interferase family)
VLPTLPELPVVSGANAIRALEQLGFVVVRQRGSHVVLRSAQNGCVIPLHRELKRGTLAGILRQANVEVATFIEALD